MTDHLTTRRLLDIAKGSPTALTAALERAVATGNRELERAVLLALAELGIVVVDRGTLADAVGEHSSNRGKLQAHHRGGRQPGKHE